VALDRPSGDLEERERYTPLYPSLDLQQLEVQVHGRLELGLLGTDSP
jgi:hypothetical protein